MTRDEAAKLLGKYPVPFDPAEPAYPRAAWAAAVKSLHADTSADGTSNAELIAKLTKARDLLLQTGPEPCTSCRGTGKVRGRFGSVDCGACKGTGDKQ